MGNPYFDTDTGCLLGLVTRGLLVPDLQAEIEQETREGAAIYNAAGVEIDLADSNDEVLLVSRSEFITYAQAVPYRGGTAGDTHVVMRPDTGSASYCLPHEWFTGGVAPYPVFALDTEEQVFSVQIPNVCSSCRGAGKLDLREYARSLGVSPAEVLRAGLAGVEAGAGQMGLFSDEDVTGSVECPKCHGTGEVYTQVVGLLGDVMHAVCLSTAAHAGLLRDIEQLLEAAGSTSSEVQQKVLRFGHFLRGFASVMDSIRLAREPTEDVV